MRTALNDRLAQINVAAGLPRAESRDAFLRDLSEYLAPIRRTVTTGSLCVREIRNRVTVSRLR